MTRTKLFTVPAVVAGALGIGAGAVRAAEPTTEELMQQIQQLQAKVQQLESRQQALASKDVDATIQSILRDADRRSQLLQMEGFTAGYHNGKFLIQDAQGNWVLNPFLQFQFRSVTNWRDEAKGDDSDIENGLQVRRMKVGFAGNAVNPDLQYYFLWATDSGGVLELEQAFVKYFVADEIAVRAGQFTNPVIREQNVSSTKQLAVDRSLVNQLITRENQSYTQAVSVIYDPKDGPISVEVGIGDGFSTDNTGFVDPFEGGSTNWGAFGRVNWLVMGDSKSASDFSAMGNKEDLLLVGGGLDVTQVGDSTAYLHTVDAQWENASGLGVYGAFLGSYLDEGSSDDSFYNWGALVQVGYLLNEEWEVFARYDYTAFDEDLGLDEDSYNEFTAGVNYFLSKSHAAKVTLDLTFLPDGSPSDITGLGILEGTENQIVFRAQVQLAI